MMLKLKWILATCFMLFAAHSYANKVIILSVDGAIGPATQDYIVRGIEKAKKEKANAIVLKLNTPGGLASTTRNINQAIIGSPVPFITYVAPSGARAASAGTFILMASHYAAMADGTNIGAASPVSLASSQENKNTDTLRKKALNDTVAYMKSLAELRKRNVKWAIKSVTEAASISALEAKKLNVINSIASDIPELLKQADNTTVTIAGDNKKIQTKNATIIDMPTDWHYDFLSFLTNPNIAYIFLMIAIYGIFFELANPGLVLPGVAGLISALLVMYAFQLMPVNYTGLLLVLIGVGFVVAEMYIASSGIIGIGGVIAFVIGSVMLFDSTNPHFQLTWTLIFLMSALTVAFFLVILSVAIKSHKKSAQMGKEGLIGEEGEVVSVMNKQIIVRIQSEHWEARCDTMLEKGQTVKVTKIKGLKLFVKPIESNK